MTAWDPLDDFVCLPATHEGVTRDVYRKGTGPCVVVMAEVPGITPEVAAFARRLVELGLTVWLPVLFGTPGAPRTMGNTVGVIGRACIAREFAVLASHRSSPVTSWLRALCREAHAACGGPGVGALGMCFTGNFALALMLEPAVIAPVLSQPSLPFAATPALARGLHVSDEELAAAKRRARDEGATVIGLRFTHDITCPRARFQALEDALGDGFEGHEIDSGPGNPWGHSRFAHSVLTNDLIDAEGQPTRAALERVLGYFAERLLGRVPTTHPTA